MSFQPCDLPRLLKPFPVEGENRLRDRLAVAMDWLQERGELVLPLPYLDRRWLLDHAAKTYERWDFDQDRLFRIPGRKSRVRAEVLARLFDQGKISDYNSENVTIARWLTFRFCLECVACKGKGYRSPRYATTVCGQCDAVGWVR